MEHIASARARVLAWSRNNAAAITSSFLHTTAILIWIVAIGLAAVATGCRGSGGKSPASKAAKVGSIAVESDRFPHALHTGNNPQIRNWKGRGLACADCHDNNAVRAGKVARPGFNQHSPCDSCHKDEFYKPPGPLCKVCHVSVDPKADPKSPTATQMQPYPDRGSVAVLASKFSHRMHLDNGKMEGSVGFHIQCADCHVRDEQTRDPKLPGHKECARCHEGEAKAKAALTMDNCAGCHPQRGVETSRGRVFIVGDLKFAHATHEKTKDGNDVQCATCHADVKDSDSREQVTVPAMERCAQCHEDSHRTPDKDRIAHCEVCHTTIRAGDAPGNHMVTGNNAARPIDHTLAFRSNHGEKAARDDANCRFCHTELSGPAQDTCFQCHSVMKPKDHNLAFSDDHGRAAQADSQRCATCHEPDTCVACHSVPPRSHTPLADFTEGGHAAQARISLEACLTCHTYETTCARCHRGTR